MKQGMTIDDYRRELRRAAWRISYRQRIRKSKELIWSDWGEENSAAANGATGESEKLREYLELIPFDNGRKVIEEIFVKDSTEAEAAVRLGISQQGVNKWKRKSLDYLRRTLETTNS
ncbi:hypothetical protein CDO73_09590 [Saccharibacillus sp. O23]|uniref:hypothetical protein n=1 Tax=Saccharibacillus sp. O23 TaxID=2009338 RepID=UPI000B4E72C6|nr:hypothetical protein [Saccharibacillus sp. O23]OWR30830.1 hypothetical protein CDO73_09590 [Saccharibacillus sp. O23]